MVEAFRPLAMPMIARAVARAGDWTADAIWDGLRSGLMLLWLITDGTDVKAIAVTELIATPKEKLCRITLCAGRERAVWTHLIADIERFAAGEGCTALRIEGRRGWARIFKDYRQPFVTLEKRIHARRNHDDHATAPSLHDRSVGPRDSTSADDAR